MSGFATEGSFEGIALEQLRQRVAAQATRDREASGRIEEIATKSLKALVATEIAETNPAGCLSHDL